jgi:hypothetical protein
MWVMSNLVSVPLETVLVLVCTVCVERTIGSETIFDALMELLGDVGHVESHFGLFGDSVSVSVI